MLRQAAALRRLVLLLGPPGVSKTTMLREMDGAENRDRDEEHWVTGDEQLSAHELVGTFDPSVYCARATARSTSGPDRW